MSDRALAWAVIPTGGKGTRMYPAAAVVPKALLPVGLWPMLHWALDEAVRARIGGVVLVIGPEQGLVRDYLAVALRAGQSGDEGDLAQLGRGLANIQVRWVEQPEPRGIGDAFIRCRDVTRDEPFGVLLPDNWFHAAEPAIAQVARTYWRTGLCTLGLTDVTAEDATLFGNVGGVRLAPIAEESYRIEALQDKKGGTFQSHGQTVLRGCARYVLGPEFYDALSATGPPATGEWDDVPAFQHLIESHGLSGHRIDGKHYDVGLPAGYAAAAAWLQRQR